jgi:sarcosine oxidase/L-pipecolate oxidase
VTAAEIEEQYPFKNLKPEWEGLFAPDNGVINVQLLLRTLYGLAKDYGAQAKQHTQVKQIRPLDKDKSIWEVHATVHDAPITYLTKKIIITSGSYVNHVLKPSFGISLRLEIWEMVATYFNTNAGPNGTIFPSKYSPIPISTLLTAVYRYVVSVRTFSGWEISPLLWIPDSPLGAT